LNFLKYLLILLQKRISINAGGLGKIIETKCSWYEYFIPQHPFRSQSVKYLRRRVHFSRERLYVHNALEHIRQQLQNNMSLYMWIYIPYSIALPAWSTPGISIANIDALGRQQQQQREALFVRLHTHKHTYIYTPSTTLSISWVPLYEMDFASSLRPPPPLPPSVHPRARAA
jgi:hypothetical protein